MFSEDSILRVAITAPFEEMRKTRDREIQYDGASIAYVGPDGAETLVPLSLSLRGNSRLEFTTCAFPPLRLKFSKPDRKGTIFKGLKKVKMVTQCQPKSNRSRDDLLTEYQVYRLLNTLTDWSYRVRLLDVTYIDSATGKSRQNYAFLIEPSKQVAKRLGGQKINVSDLTADRLAGQHMNLISLYQMMVGNTDWSATHGGSDECCHNGKLFDDPALSQVRYLPYDFDMTGLVEPKYAATSEKVNLSSVRKRLYRGYCRNIDHIAENIDLLNQSRDEIVAILNEDIGLSNGQLKSNQRYIRGFYDFINNPKRLNRHVSRFCMDDPGPSQNIASDTKLPADVSG